MNELFFSIKYWIIPTLSVLATAITVLAGIKSLRRNKKLIEVETNNSVESEIRFSGTSKNRDVLDNDSKISFEAMKLSEYYSQVLSQSRISFWFSLIFASIGFLVILLGALTFVDSKLSSSVITMISGLIIDSVSALFFVQSKSAQKSMSDFFEKLRLDRGISDSKEICETISDSSTKDAIKVRLALHLAGISESMIMAQDIVDTIKKK